MHVAADAFHNLAKMQVEDGDGGALSVWTEFAAGSGNRLRLQEVDLTGNSCGKGQGGALALDSQGLEMQDVTVSGNTVCGASTSVDGYCACSRNTALLLQVAVLGTVLTCLTQLSTRQDFQLVFETSIHKGFCPAAALFCLTKRATLPAAVILHDVTM
jgi:hypothetical protein